MKKARVRGSLTIFFALLLAGILAMTGVCLEYARAQVISASAQSAAAAACESIFAGYHAPLFREYEIFGRMVADGDFESLEKETLRYASAWGEGGAVFGNPAAFKAKKAEWSGVIFLTDQNGAVFRSLAVDAMKTSSAEILTDLLQKQLGLDQSGVLEVLGKYAGKDKISGKDVLKGYEDMKEAVKQAEDAEREEAERKAEEARMAEEEQKAEEGKADEDGAGSGDESDGKGSPGSTGGDASGQEGRGEKVDPKPSPEEKKAAEDRAKGKKFLDLIETVKKLLDGGLLSLLLPADEVVSAARIPSGGLPSSLGSSEKSRCVRRVGGASELLFREYFMRHMTSWGSEGDRSPCYEIEYLISGKKNDRANLAAAVNRILWIRIGLNMLYLSTDSSKQAQAKEAALLAAGWTGNPALVEAVSILLLAAWAAAESLGDVRELLAGRQVPLLKTELTFWLSLENAARDVKSCVTGSGGEEAGDGKAAEAGSGRSGDGLSYEDYLRLLLYLCSDKSLSYRGMDIITWNLRRIDHNFVMSECIAEGKLELSIESKTLFAPIYQSVVRGAKRKKNKMVKASAYSYLTD